MISISPAGERACNVLLALKKKHPDTGLIALIQEAVSQSHHAGVDDFRFFPDEELLKSLQDYLNGQK